MREQSMMQYSPCSNMLFWTYCRVGVSGNWTRHPPQYLWLITKGRWLLQAQYTLEHIWIYIWIQTQPVRRGTKEGSGSPRGLQCGGTTFMRMRRCTEGENNITQAQSVPFGWQGSSLHHSPTKSTHQLLVPPTSKATIFTSFEATPPTFVLLYQHFSHFYVFRLKQSALLQHR